MPIFQIISSVVSILTLLGFGVIMKNFWEDKREKSKLASQEEKLRIKKEKQDEMREVLNEELSPIKDAINNINAEIELNTVGTVTLLRDRMKNSLDEARKRGWVHSEDIANWKELYNSYKSLGGNHFKEFVDEWKREMENFPSEQEYKDSKKKRIQKTN